MRPSASIRTRLLLYMIAFLIAINLCFWIFYGFARNYLDDDLGEKLSGVSEFIASGIKGDYIIRLEPGDEKTRTFRNVQARLSRAKNAFNLNKVILVDAGRKTIADAGGELVIGDPVYILKAAGVEMEQALSKVATASPVYRGADGRLYKSGYAPVQTSEGKVVSVLVAEASAAFLGELETFRNLIFVVTAISFVAVLVLAFFLSRFVATPLMRLAAATRDIKEGKYSRADEKPRRDELGFLMSAFNEMAESIQSNEEKLRNLYKKEARAAEEVRLYAETILGSIATGIVSIDTEGKVAVCNAEACRIFDIEPKEIENQPFDRATALEAFRDILTGSLVEKKVIRESPMEYVNPSGRHFYLGVSCSASEAVNEGAIAANIVLTDHTELERLQDEIKRKETLAAIGELAAHVAHEVRNPLGSMKIYIDLLARRNISPDKRQEFLAKISSEISRLNSIIDEFLQYSAPSKTNRAEFKLVDLIRDAILFARKEDYLDNIVIKEKLGQYDRLKVAADRNQLMQLFLNLFINACEAMSSGGALEIGMRVRNSPGGGVQTGKIIDSAILPEEVIVDVKDSGIGMDSETIAKMFTPFFTTKVQGTGLGMPLAQRIVDNHGGRIEVVSSVNGGTTISVRLPIAAEQL